MKIKLSKLVDLIKENERTEQQYLATRRNKDKSILSALAMLQMLDFVGMDGADEAITEIKEIEKVLRNAL